MNDLKILREKVKILSVLLVDDEADVLDRFATFMKKFFENVDSASSGKEALEKFNNHDGYDIVVTDIMMPGMIGWELIRELRKIDESLFIAAITGSPNATDTELALCDSYLTKPVSIDKMVHILEKITEKRGV